MNDIRIYFEEQDPITKEFLECFADYRRERTTTSSTDPEYTEEILLKDWGALYERRQTDQNGSKWMIGGNKKQPYWLYPIVEEKKLGVIFPEDDGYFDLNKK